MLLKDFHLLSFILVDLSRLMKMDNTVETLARQAMRIGILSSHPIQYQVPWFRELTKKIDLEVFFAHQPTPTQQGEGFGHSFTWDLDLFADYSHTFLQNTSRDPSPGHFRGCDTPEISRRIFAGGFQAFIVNGWYLKCYWQAVTACHKAGIPVMVRGDSQLMTPRSKIKTCIKEIAYRQILKRFDGFLSVGQRNLEYLLHYGVPSKKIFYAPHFVDNARFTSNVSNGSLKIRANRNAWQVSDLDLAILFVGKFNSSKRVDDLLAAVAALPKHVSFRLVFIGSGVEEQRLRELSSKLGVAPVFAGFANQSELPCCYAAADVLVLPSEAETWGLVVNEAMACGIPAIVSDACGCAPDLIDEGETGFTFPMGNVAALTECLARIAAMKQAGHDWRPALSRKMDKYSVSTCTAGTLDAVRRLITKV